MPLPITANSSIGVTPAKIPPCAQTFSATALINGFASFTPHSDPAPHPVFASMASGGESGKVVVELSHTDYLANSTQAKARHKIELDTGTVTPFTLSSGQPTGGVRETSYFWYDDAQRATTVAAYGSGNGSSGTDKWQTSALPSYGSAPTASNDYIRVTQYTYNDDTGRRETVKNWKTSGTTIVSKTFYDDLGRRKFFVENWKSGYDPNTSIGNTAGENRTTGWTYTGLGRIERLTAYNNSSSTGHQVTLYQYEDDTNASLVTRTYYPDQVNSGTGNPIGGAKFVEVAYYLDGSLNTQTDQRGVVHTYQYDTNRRVELDRVTSFGSSGTVDDTVKSIGRTYDTLGRTTHVTSYSTNNGSGTPVNQLAYTFDSYGMLAETDQEHDGAVDGSTLSVQYGYSSTASGNIFTNGLRQETIKSPWHQANSKYLRLYYGASGSATETRFDRLHQVSGQFEQNGSYPIADDYSYAGINRLARARTRWANGGANQLYLHYDGASLGDTTRGYDRFGQVVGHSTSGSAGASSFGYTYDYAGNRLTRDTQTSTNNVWDQKYAYDDLLRLATSDQGTLASGNISSPTFEEDFTLDQLGNWQNLVKKTGGSTTLDQNRAHNEANETGTIGATMGTNWADPVHDDAGNMTTIPQPKSPGNGYTAIYDAWNRMVEVKDGGTTVQANQYDGLHRRIARDESGGSGSVRHFYYNESWQCVEERDGSYAFVKRHFWHPYYIDALAASIDSTGERVSFVHDANFNVTMAVDDTYNGAQVIERYHYSPYGEVTYLNPDFSVKGAQQSSIGNEFLYTGQRLDSGTGFYYYKNRYYHAQLGRFMMRDPIGYVDGPNSYQYVKGNPVVLVDPSGEETKPAKGEVGDNGLHKGEAEALAGANCACGVLNEEVSKNTEAYVKCDGKGKCEVVYVGDKTHGDCADVCGTKDCAIKHEEHHIKQAETLCPEPGKGGKGGILACGSNLPGKPTPKEIKAATLKCQGIWECYAYKVEIDCLTKLQEEFKGGNNKTCTSKRGLTTCGTFVARQLKGKTTMMKKFCKQGGVELEKGGKEPK